MAPEIESCKIQTCNFQLRHIWKKIKYLGINTDSKLDFNNLHTKITMLKNIARASYFRKRLFKNKLIAAEEAIKFILGVELNSRCCSTKTKSLFIVYSTLYFIDSIILQKLWSLPIFHETNGCHAIRNPCFLRRSIHWSIFRYLQKTWNAVMTNYSEWHETNNNQMALCPLNMVGELRYPNPCPVYIFLRVPLHVYEHCHGANLVCHDVRRTLAACFSTLGSVSSIVVYSEQLWSFHPVSATRGIPYLLDPTKYAPSPFEHEYCISALMDLVDRQ